MKMVILHLKPAILSPLTGIKIPSKTMAGLIISVLSKKLKMVSFIRLKATAITKLNAILTVLVMEISVVSRHLVIDKHKKTKGNLGFLTS